MKRSELKRKTPLKQTQGLVRKPSPERAARPLRRSAGLGRGVGRVKPQKGSFLPGQREWQATHYGLCSVCKRPGQLERHHVVKQQHLRRWGMDQFDMRLAMEVGKWCSCHELAHNYGVNDHRFRLDQLPPAAVARARELLGDYAEDYLRRLYAPPLRSIQRREQDVSV